MPPPAPGRQQRSINAQAGPVSVVRTLVMDRDELATPTVTIGALVTISEALEGYLAERGEAIAGLGAEVTMAGPQNGVANNNFRNVGLGLHLDRGRRTGVIAPNSPTSVAVVSAPPCWPQPRRSPARPRRCWVWVCASSIRRSEVPPSPAIRWCLA